ncbi:MAG: DUF3667 domain-containing protein [Bacteroidaceae bacterium]|nr:DUF3667 domain-containing protein [Bacteroidaceae bacterium]
MTGNKNRNLKEWWRRFRAWQENPFDYTNHSEHTIRCANCGTEFRDNFCPRCGQEASVGSIGWHTVRQGILNLWGMDTRSLTFTLVQLLLRPGYLIRDYISGKRQVSYPPVNMLFIVAIANVLASELHKTLYGNAEDVEAFQGALAFMNQFMTWAQENTAWCTLLVMAFFILPTWLLFRRAPRYPRHNLPEGFFLQVYMATLSLLIDTVAQLTVLRINILFPICYIVTYRQLFGYGLWGTLWRLFFCVAIGTMLIIIAFIAAMFLFNAETLLAS